MKLTTDSRALRLGGLVAALLALGWGAGCKAPPAKRCKLAEPEPIDIDQKEGEMLLPKSVDNAPQPAVVIQITASRGWAGRFLHRSALQEEKRGRT